MMTTDEPVAVLLNEARYAERLGERTARLYRRLHWLTTIASILGGSATLSALAPAFPAWLSIAGAIALATFGAIHLSVRPLEKAVANEADTKRYARLRTVGQSMTADQLRAALNEARETSAAEVETLRDVAYNDVLVEIGRNDAVVPLKRTQRLLATLA